MWLFFLDLQDYNFNMHQITNAILIFKIKTTIWPCMNFKIFMYIYFYQRYLLKIIISGNNWGVFSLDLGRVT